MRWLTALLSLAILSLTATSPRAADTVEPWNVGATDVDFYLTHDGFDADPAGRRLGVALMLGYGLIPGLSAHIGTALETVGRFQNAGYAINLGIFGTALETDHVDLDLFLAASADSTGHFALTPSLELNLDRSPDLAAWGGYLRFGLPIEGADDGGGPAVSLGLTVGLYYTVSAGHQLLTEVDAVFRPTPRGGDPAAEVGGLALGYNVGIHRAIELITQVSVDIPQGDERVGFGVMVGLIATLPAGGSER